MDHKIGNVKIKNQLVLAPMAGITDIAFRVLCKRFGAGLVYTEMVNADAIVRNNKSTLRKAIFCEEERPVAVQLFGAKEKELVEAAKIIEKQGADIIDFNLGCPDLKVMKQGAGSALLKRPKKISELVSAIVKSVNIPVTAKIRLGVRDNQGLKTAKIVEEAGAAAIAVHGRTVEQGYSGKADWNAIREIKQNLKIPVIGSGDIFSGADAKKMLEQTGVDFIMIGRGAIGNPQIFSEIRDHLEGKPVKSLSSKEKIGLFFEYLKLTEKYDCFDTASAKVQACDFTKGIRYSTGLRRDLSQAKTIDEIKQVLADFEKNLRE